MTISAIIVGCDLSVSSDHALDRALAIAERQSIEASAPAKVVMVHAQSSDAPVTEVDNAALEQLGEVSAAVRAEEARQLADRLVTIQERGLRVEVVSRVGPADEVLAAVALEQHAELIVVGTHGHTGIAHFLLGSVASSTIRHTPCDVLVVRTKVAPPALPPGDAPVEPASIVALPMAGTFERPLVAIDFSPTSAQSIEHAARLCKPGTPIDVVHAWQLPAGSWGASLLGQARFPWSTVRDAVVAGAQTAADKVVAQYAGLPHPLNVELVQGPAAQVITKMAEQRGNDLIVVGAHGHRGVRRLLLGSVAESTVRHAPCSVLVVHTLPAS